MKTNTTRIRPLRRGFMLMESLLALSIFGIAVTGVVLALHQAHSLNRTVIKEQWAQQEAKNVLLEVLTIPPDGNGIERDYTLTIDSETEARIVVEPYEVVDKDENLLEDLYRVTVTLNWFSNDERVESTYSTVHYANMFAASN